MLARDQSQKVFSQSFEEFSGRMVPPRLTRGANMLKQYGSVLARIEQTYGVPGEVLVAIWGLETDFGVNIGKFPTLRSLATLAYDCRRADLFKAELMDALRIVERGDIAPQEMRGAWAGEIGQTQFMPSSYIKYAVDFDGNGRRDLLRSAPDVLASTANFLASHGWQRGKDWEPGSANFAVIQQWNKSEVYAKTIGYFATPACARALNRRNSKGRSHSDRPFAELDLLRHAGVHRLAEMRAQAPILPLSMASCAAAISFCAIILPSPSAMFSIMDSVLLEVVAAAACSSWRRWPERRRRQRQPLRLLRVTY